MHHFAVSYWLLMGLWIRNETLLFVFVLFFYIKMVNGCIKATKLVITNIYHDMLRAFSQQKTIAERCNKVWDNKSANDHKQNCTIQRQTYIENKELPMRASDYQQHRTPPRISVTTQLAPPRVMKLQNYGRSL